MTTTQFTSKGTAMFSSIFDTRRNSLLAWVLLGLIFTVGLAVRLYDLSDPPLDFHPTRQLHSALIARGMYYERHPEAPAWQREMAITEWHAEGLIEPQIFERIVAWTYELTAGPNLAVPRLYAILFWMIGAVFLAWLAYDLIGWGGALVTALFFLIWPYGVVASRAFQPEPLMIALMLSGLWSAVRWHQRGSWKWAVTAGLLCGLAIYIKSVAVFFIGPALTALALSTCRPRELLRSRPVWAMAVLSLLPYGIYLIDGVYVHGYLVGQFSLRFFPEMWHDPAFYLRWISNLGRAVPFEMALIALIGALLVQRPAYRWMLIMMWGGYFIYGMTLPHHISTHDYYHLLLFPVVGLGLGAAAEVIFQAVRGPRWLARTAVTMILLAALVIIAYEARTTLKRNDSRAQVAVWETVGREVGAGASMVALVPDYGGGLKYWGWINPTNWLTADEILWRKSIGQAFDFNEQFNSLAAGKDFFLVTQLDELERQPELKSLLYSRYKVYREAPGYILFDLRASKQP